MNRILAHTGEFFAITARMGALAEARNFG